MICGSYPPDKCGVGEYTCSIVAEMNKDINNEIYVFTSTSIITKSKITKFGERKWLLKDVLYLYNLIKMLKCDIIHMQFPSKAYRKSFGIIILYIALSIKYKTMITVHEYSDSPFIGKIRTLALIIFSKRILVVDKRYKDDLIKILPFYKEKIKYIPISSMIPKNNIEENEIAITSLKKCVVQDFHNKIILGYFGFVNKSKGIESLINLGAKLKKMGIDFKLLFLCEFNINDEYHCNLIKIIKDKNLTADIKITGYLDNIEVANYISICDFMIYPFVNGLSTKNSSFLAAEMQGVPVITTKPKLNSFNKETVNSNVYFIEKFNDVDSIVDIIISYKGSGRIKDIMIESWSNISDKITNIYKQLNTKNNHSI